MINSKSGILWKPFNAALLDEIHFGVKDASLKKGKAYKNPDVSDGSAGRSLQKTDTHAVGPRLLYAALLWNSGPRKIPDHGKR